MQLCLQKHKLIQKEHFLDGVTDIHTQVVETDVVMDVETAVTMAVTNVHLHQKL